MNTFRLFSILLITNLLACQTPKPANWDYYTHTNFAKYKTQNQQLAAPKAGKRVVFMGDSITEFWPKYSPSFFQQEEYIGRGISGQTTSQMILRFREDVIKLQPDAMVLLAGINDIAQNNGYTPIETIADNIKMMVELALVNDIEVILCAVLPAIDFPWKRGLNPANKVIELNNLLSTYAKDKDILFVDYHAAMKDNVNGLKVPEYTSAEDLVHPNEVGYKRMEALVQPAIISALMAKN